MAGRTSLPQKLEVSQFDVESLYKQRVGKLVLMVIDALRCDFISGRYMTFTSKMISEGKASSITARAHPPTVTLPRLKAMMTGTLPNYIDVLMNFGSSTLTIDSVIRQVANRRMNVVFYGDDTWIKLYPTEFTRSEGTVSFFVNDFIEVDTNVTRNLRVELARNDWDVMILHYLGLDHIGHLEGPSSVHVKPKLHEMDDVIAEIYDKLEENDVLIVCGDHGMKDSGGHGGTSLPELLVPVIIFNHISDCDDQSETINQIDIAPFISFLLGTPIPGDNIGKLNYCLLKHYDPYSVLYALHYNAQQMGNLYINYYEKRELESASFKNFLSAANLFDKWIQTGFTNQYNISALWHYSRSLDIMSNELILVRAQFDLYSMIVSVLMLILVFITTLLKDIDIQLLNFLSIIMGITIVSICGNYTYCIISSYDTGLCSQSISHVMSVAVIAIFIAVKISIILYSQFEFKLPYSKELVFIGVALQTVSLGSSSMVEEEHQVWYFLFVSMCLYFMYKRSGSKKMLIVLMFHRFLRNLNQTGDKWANLSDVGDWLNIGENKQLLSIIYFLTLLIIGGIILHISNQNLFKEITTLKCLHLFSTLGLIMFIYCYRSALGNISFPLIDYPLSKGLLEVKGFWIFFVLFVIVYMSGISYNSASKNILIFQLSGLFFQVFLLIISLLYRPHNCLLLASLFLFVSFFNSGPKLDVELLTFVHYFLGKVFYFYQGNSNSLANIDVGVGYTGLTDYNMFTTGCFLFIHTFAAPLLSYILLVYFLSNKGEFQKNRAFVYQTILFILVQEMLFYSIVVILQRHHLFVWSVFSPKLLYISVHIGLYTVLIFFTEFLYNFVDLLTGQKLHKVIYLNC
ncbi:hypothetical protein AAG570_011388 [Ranatra chinensis]|uniref:GPI ethanolamine phosphate transferase 2 C-terminal domain-containing protein n=1 Tax=Ranatra chinensis TaxID=642074 RepID=A0ABD0YKI7_9HEMI